MRIEVTRQIKYSGDLEDIYDNFNWEDIRSSYDLKPWEGMEQHQVHDALMEELSNMFMADIDELLEEEDDDFNIEIYGGL